MLLSTFSKETNGFGGDCKVLSNLHDHFQFRLFGTLLSVTLVSQQISKAHENIQLFRCSLQMCNHKEIIPFLQHHLYCTSCSPTPRSCSTRTQITLCYKQTDFSLFILHNICQSQTGRSGFGFN